MVKTLIWIYILICLSLIFFQCAFIAVMAIRSAIDRARVSRMRRGILRQLELIAAKKPVDEKHHKFLRENLPYTPKLYSYEKALRLLFEKSEDSLLSLRDPDEITNVTIYIRHRAIKEEERSRGRSHIFMRLRPKKALIIPLPRETSDFYLAEYIRQTSPDIVSLTDAYRRKDNIIHAFYVFMLKKYGYLRHVYTSELVANLKDLLDNGDCICEEGVLLAIYQMGVSQFVLDALLAADVRDSFLHPKIISDGLLSFSGNAAELQTLLLDNLDLFSIPMRANILNYIRFASGAHCARLLALMQDESTPNEVRFSCIRYFGKYPYEPAYDLLARFAEGVSGNCIEYSIIALTVLRRYPSERTREILCANINSPNWFIRYNSTESLEVLGYEYLDLIDIFEGGDRFARDILQYQFDQRYILNEEVIDP